MTTKFTNGLRFPAVVVKAAALEAAYEAAEAARYARRLLALPAQARGVSAQDVHTQVLRADALATSLARRTR